MMEAVKTYRFMDPWQSFLDAGEHCPAGPPHGKAGFMGRQRLCSIIYMQSC